MNKPVNKIDLPAANRRQTTQVGKLIADLCPEGVEFKTLDEVIHFMNGKGHEKYIDENGD